MINPNDTFAGQWEQLRPKMREQWKALTDDDLDRAEGSTDVLASILSEKYGYVREKAFQEIHKFAQANLSTVKVGKP